MNFVDSNKRGRIYRLAILIVMLGYLWSCAVKPNDLGATEGLFSPCSSKPNCVCSQADSTDKVHYMEAWPMSDFDADKAQLLKAIEAFGNTKVISNEDKYLHVEFTTGWMKYIDDVQFYFDLSDQKIHFKSASRVGYSDMGVNRKRMTRLKELFEAS